MKKQILFAAFTGALLAATAVFAQDAANPRRASAPNEATTETNTPVAAPAPSQAAPPSSNQTPQPADQPPPATATATNTSTIITLKNGEKGLVMNFRGVPLETVLNYMSDAAGLVINPDNRVDVNGKVNLWSVQPVSKEDAIKMLMEMLSDNGYTAIRNDRMLTIMRADDASKRDIPVHKDNDPDHIPKTPTIVTQIIPVRSLNVVQLVKNLQTLLPSNATISADESANSVILTDTQANIHRIAEIIAALDSVTSGNATIQVFPLKYADAKTLAQLIKDLFPSADTANQAGGTRGGGFGRFRAMMGMMGGGGPGGDTGGGDSNGHTPTAKVSAVSDDHSNSLVVSAPDELMPTIERLVNEVDKPVEDTTVAEIFHLKNADPTEMADMLTSLFPDDTNQSDASRQPVGFRGFPGFGGFGQQANNSSPSDRMKKMARVSAVPDRRTSSLIVTAGTNVMEQIRGIVEDLDKRSDRKMKPFAISLQNADPADVLPILQGLFPATTGTSASSSSYNQQNNYLQQRATTQLQNQNNQNSTSGFGTTGSGSRTGN